MKSKLFVSLVFLLFVAFQLNAQCPMCSMSVASNLKSGGTQGLGLNAGIISLLAMPYLIVGGLAFVWWRNRKHDEIDLLEE